MKRALAAARAGSVLSLDWAVRLRGDVTAKRKLGYTRHYHRHLAPLRYRRNRVLEIGVGGWVGEDGRQAPSGPSLEVWRDYMPRSRIVGFDIVHSNIDLGDRVGFVQGDQTSPVDLDRAVEALGGTPNIVVDDGSHLVDHARTSFEHLFPLMPPGSLYIVEDLHTSYYPDWGGGLPAPPGTAVGLCRDLVDSVQVHDKTFQRSPAWGPPPEVVVGTVAELHVYPGAFVAIKVGG